MPDKRLGRLDLRASKDTDRARTGRGRRVYAAGAIPNLEGAFARNPFGTYRSFVFEPGLTVGCSAHPDARRSLVEWDRAVNAFEASLRHAPSATMREIARRQMRCVGERFDHGLAVDALEESLRALG